MNAELKSKWLANLRSGKFSQTRSSLRDAAGHCCLGVLAETMGCEWKLSNEPWLGGKTLRNNAGDWLNDDLSGIKFDQQRIVAKMNDNGATFDEIANYVEANF